MNVDIRCIIKVKRLFEFKEKFETIYFSLPTWLQSELFKYLF